MMHSWHMAEFRAPSSQQTFEYTKSSDQELRLTHFLAADCSCSLHLLDYFIKRGALKDHPEKIVLIGDIPKKEAALKKAGFVIEKVTMEEAMKSDAFMAVPLLIIHQKDQVLYTGGYTQGAITPLSDFFDLAALEAVKKNETPSSLPIKGCAVAQSFQKALDPLGLKYRSPSHE